jgi:hypothetical protein
MGFMKCYEFININKLINERLGLNNNIRIISFSPDKNYLCKNIHIKVLDNHKELEDFYINPRKKIKIKSKYLNEMDKNKVNEYFSKYGSILLDYQLYKIDYRSLNIFK